MVKELRAEFHERFEISSVLEVMAACGKRVFALPISETIVCN